jgi:signal transduction histidine kinase
VQEGLEVTGDRPLLAAAVINLLQNAFKFSHAHGQVTLKTTATAERVRFEIEDSCGGLPPGKAEELFHPFTQRSANRRGLGLGLSISRRGVEASGGEVRVRNLPGKGCIFTIDLPRRTPAA